MKLGHIFNPRYLNWVLKSFTEVQDPNGVKI